MADVASSSSAPATALPLAAATEDAPPNHTLYVKNLNDKIKGDRLTAALYAAFSAHGKVLEVLLGKGRRLRGQAWVTFEDVASASNALRAMNGAVLFEKPAVVHFARDQADVIARREGTFVPREKRKLDTGDAARAPKKASAPASSSGSSGSSHPTTTTTSSSNGNGNGGGMPAFVPPPPPPPALNLPHKILFLQDLPESCNQEMLSVLFKQYHGFKEVRMVPGKKGLAFVEFGDDAQAAIALQGLAGFKLTPTDALKVSFAKK
ncbi:hypothetical protein PybrP1_010150 [[Pythium] brassicae (nom. inval.)]|nr:hypothetical protein PybrP1_010150 [[Pythium] brassicae (nom. inval.)]